MTRFVIDLGELELDADKRSEINEELQGTALEHLVKAQVSKPFAFRYPREWWGFILRDDIDILGTDLERISKTLSPDLKSSRFVVDLGDIDLSREEEKELNHALQTTVMKKVATFDTDLPIAVRFPVEWLGIVIGPDFERLEAGIGEVSRAVEKLGA